MTRFSPLTGTNLEAGPSFDPPAFCWLSARAFLLMFLFYPADAVLPLGGLPDQSTRWALAGLITLLPALMSYRGRPSVEICHIN